MKRLVVLPTILLTFVLLAGTPAVAVGNAANRDTSGPFTGTSVFNSTPACNFFQQTYDATYKTDQNKFGTVHLDGCVGLPSGPGPDFPYAGTFILAAPNGATLRGTVSGLVGNATSGCAARAFPSSLNFTLRPADGTKQLQHVAGTIALTGIWCSPASPGVAGPISGTLSANLH